MRCNNRDSKSCQPCDVAVVCSASCYVDFYQYAIKVQEKGEVTNTKQAKSRQNADTMATATKLLIIVPIVLGSASNDLAAPLRSNDISANPPGD